MISALLANPEWDAPFFKVMANNDTGAASGHQGGAVIPKDLRQYFPSLVGITSTATPTTDLRIIADLYAENKFLATVNARYQLQTWGGERGAESRLTQNLGPLRDLANGGDILLIQRNLVSLDHYRLILVRKSSKEYQDFKFRIGASRWGTLESTPPMTQADIVSAAEIETVSEAGAFDMFDLNAKTIESRGVRVARSVVFRETVKKLYSCACSICAISLAVPDGPSDFEAAHIVPRSVLGADDARNGLGLCRRHHWAFDKGLFGIDTKRCVHVPRLVRALNANRELVVFEGRSISEAGQSHLMADDRAFGWHMENIVNRFK